MEKKSTPDRLDHRQNRSKKPAKTQNAIMLSDENWPAEYKEDRTKDSTKIDSP